MRRRWKIELIVDLDEAPAEFVRGLGIVRQLRESRWTEYVPDNTNPPIWKPVGEETAE